MAEFYKVPFEQFKKDCQSIECGGSLWFAKDDKIHEIYDSIQLPRRGEPGSAGYDFYLPFNTLFSAINPVLVPTGVGVRLNPGTFLMCVPRSGLGFRYGMRLKNTVGVIDESYSQAENFGHIMAKMICDEGVELKAGDRFMQGIIVNYGIVDNDSPINDSRTGGFGSTGGTA